MTKRKAKRIQSGIIIAAFVFIASFAPVFAIPAHCAPADQYRPQITREAQFRFGIPAPVPVIAGQIQQESAWNPLSLSRVGAKGLMQFMPATANWSETVNHWGVVDPFNPAWAIRAGVWYDRWLYERVKGDTECDKWHFALSAYNGGLGYVYKRQKLSITPTNWQATGHLNPGITAANQRENEEYPLRILFKHQPKFQSWGHSVCLG
jgi:soluble lytic murein transglycosylase-like protein